MLQTSSGLPANQHATLRQNVSIDRNQTIDIDVPMVTVSGALTVGGDGVETDYATYLYLVRERSDLAVAANLADGPSYSVAVVPGTYDIYYSSTYVDPALPSNMSAKLREGVTIDEDRTLDIDVPAITLEGEVLVNGSPAPAGADAIIYLVNDGGDRVVLAHSSAGSYATVIVPGTYDVVYTAQGDDPVIPQNRNAVLAEDVSFEESGTFDVDVPMVAVTGDFRVNGSTPAASAYAFLWFDTPADDYVSLADFQHGYSYSASVIPGTYDIKYGGVTALDGLPDNLAGLVAEEVVVAASRTLDVDVPLITVTATTTVNGETPDFLGSAQVLLNTEAGDVLLAAPLGAASHVAEVMPGTYDLSYAIADPGSGAPQNLNAPLGRRVTLEEDMTLDIELPMTSLTGALTLNGAPETVAADGGLQFRKDANDVVELPNTSAASYAIELIPGTYNIQYKARTPGTGVPANTLRSFACVRVE